MDAHKNAHTHTHKSLHANSHMGEVLEIRFWTIYLTSTCVKKKKKSVFHTPLHTCTETGLNSDMAESG